MESITKNRQSAATLRTMVARAYGAEQVPAEAEDWVGELGHGWFNVAYRIRLRDGPGWSLKIAPPPDVEVMTYERGAMRIELASLALINANARASRSRTSTSPTRRHELVRRRLLLHAVRRCRQPRHHRGHPAARTQRTSYERTARRVQPRAERDPRRAVRPPRRARRSDLADVFTGWCDDVLVRR